MEDNFAGLENVLPETVTVSAKGETIEIKPFKFKNFLTVLKLVFGILGNLNLGDLEDGGDILVYKALVDNADAAIKIMAISTGKDENWFDDIDSDEALEIAAKVYQVNLDFFTQKVAPKLSGLKKSQESQKAPETENEKNTKKDSENETLLENEQGEVLPAN